MLSQETWIPKLCKKLGRARSLSVLICARYDAWEELSTFKCLPSDYLDHDIDAFQRDYLITELLRKYVPPAHLGQGHDAAITMFFKCEEQCKLTNIRLRTMRSHIRPDIDNCFYAVLAEARKTIAAVLGELPNTLRPKFSPGSTYNNKSDTLPMAKMTTRPTVTQKAWEVIHDMFRHEPWYTAMLHSPAGSTPLFVHGAQHSTVPKDATTDRNIEVGPSLNVAYQLAIGSHMRQRLKKVNIDLDFNQSVHQRLAQLGSTNLSLATIDLQNASSTIATSVVQLLLPTDWFDLLDALRTHKTVFKDEEGKATWHDVEMFSGMGNGFTFELESLIFYALTRATVNLCGLTHRRTVAVYGDDIICPIDAAPAVMKVLRFFGFIPNERKTFVNQFPFRESCGGDFFRGCRVYKHNLKKLPSEPLETVRLMNRLRTMAKTFGEGLNLFSDAWHDLRASLPTQWRNVTGPESLGDLVVNIDTRTSSCRLKLVYERSCYIRYNSRKYTPEAVLSAALMRAIPGESMNNGLILRRFSKHSEVRVKKRKYTWNGDSRFNEAQQINARRIDEFLDRRNKRGALLCLPSFTSGEDALYEQWTLMG